MNADKPFVLRGGNTEQVSLFNRIACLARVEHLTGINLQRKSIWYRYALDLEMYQRWYKDEPKNKPIDEEFCQRMAIVVKDMEKDASMYDNATEMGGRVASAYRDYKLTPKEEPKKTKTKTTWLNGIFKPKTTTGGEND